MRTIWPEALDFTSTRSIGSTVPVASIVTVMSRDVTASVMTSGLSRRGRDARTRANATAATTTTPRIHKTEERPKLTRAITVSSISHSAKAIARRRRAPIGPHSPDQTPEPVAEVWRGDGIWWSGPEPAVPEVDLSGTGPDGPPSASGSAIVASAQLAC